MLTINIGCVLVNELPGLQIFTSIKHENKLYSTKFSDIFLELNASLSIARHISV